MNEPFNPLDMKSLAQSIVNQMDAGEPIPLGKVHSFRGAGIYAIYYSGNHPAYEPLLSIFGSKWVEPVYIGKAVPAGGRRGFSSESVTTALYKRITEHAKSIQASENLCIEDFGVRWLVIEDIWIPLGESAMLRRHLPVWNSLLDGFGNHNPGSGRVNGVRTRWYTLHPGRTWASQYPARGETASQLAQEVTEYLKSRFE